MIYDKKILLVGAHPDDLEFGMGATMLGMVRPYVLVLSDTTNVNGDEILNDFNSSMKLYGFSSELYKEPQTMKFYEYEDKIKNLLFQRKKELHPDLIFCPSHRSHNLDHQYTAAFVKNVFQEQTILMYETPRGDFDHKPNMWNEISQTQLDMKIKALSRYTTQSGRHYISAESIIAMARFRGTQVGKQYAETFEVARICLNRI